MSRREFSFWFAVGLVSIASLAIFKVLAAQGWAPEGAKRLAGFL